MISIESKILTDIKNLIEPKYNGSVVESSLLREPTQYPHVSVNEIDNITYEHTIDSGSNENHCSLVYDIHIESNLRSGKKTICKAILQDVDNYMIDLGFKRTICKPYENENNYKVVLRYKGIVSKELIITRS